uniref:Uncharacterized protein n=1 Tax=Rhizophora mucronata TaxID=61149 RepID=A0A2P2QU08_RHIMU
MSPPQPRLQVKLQFQDQVVKLGCMLQSLQSMETGLARSQKMLQTWLNLL